MANVKISQLPSWSGSASDLRWFVMNNSGETETYKYSGYTSPYKVVGSNNTNNIYDTTAMGGTFGSIIGGSSNTISGGINNAIIGGSSNTNSSTRGVVVGGNGNTAGGTSNIVGGENNTTNGYVAFAYGTNNQNGAEVAFIGGGASCNAAGQTIGIIGAEQATTVGSTSVMKQSFIGGGFQNNITESLRAGIIAGQSNSIISSPDSAIIGGTGNTISGKTNVVMSATSGRTASASATTYTENLHVYRTPSTEVQSVSSGTTFTCNLDNGGKAQFYLTGASTIDITNVRDGQSFLIKTQTDGGHTITWTSTGYTFLFKGGSSNPGNNKIDMFRFDVFGTVIYGELISDFS